MIFNKKKVRSFIYRSFLTLFPPSPEQKRRIWNPFHPGKRASADPLHPGSALLWGGSLWQLSSSEQERKWLLGAVLNSPSTGRKSGLNEAISRIGHAVRVCQSSHPLIRLQYFLHPFAGNSKVREIGLNHICDKMTYSDGTVKAR